MKHLTKYITILSMFLLSNAMNNTMQKNSIHQIKKQDIVELNIEPGQIWRHYKNKDYRILVVSCHSEDLTWYVVYEALYDNQVSKIWHRPLDMFLGTVYVNNEVKPRFQRIQ